MTNPTTNEEIGKDYSVKPVAPADHPSSIQITIPMEYCGLRLDQALAKLLPDWSRSRLQLWIAEHRITIDNQIPSAKQKVRGGEQALISPQTIPSSSTYAAEAIDLDIIHEDEALIVVNKPAGLVTHPGNGNWQGTLLNALLHHAPQLENIPRAGIVHRLDKDTSGLLVIAKTLAAQTKLVRQLQQRTVRREYMALVLGTVQQAGSVNAPIGRHPIHRTKMAIVNTGKMACTNYKIIEKFEGCTLLYCSLETGRTHQIRVHMQSINHPLVGDPIYSGKLPKTDTTIAHLLINFPRQALHARKLALIHPQTEQYVLWQANTPADLQYLLDKIRQHIQHISCI